MYPHTSRIDGPRNAIGGTLDQEIAEAPAEECAQGEKNAELKSHIGY